MAAGFRDLWARTAKRMEDSRRIAQSLSGQLPVLGIDPRCVTAAPFRRFPIHFGSSIDVCLSSFGLPCLLYSIVDTARDHTVGGYSRSLE